MPAPTPVSSADLVEGTGTRSFAAQATQAGDYLVVSIQLQDDQAVSFPVTATGLSFTVENDTGTGSGLRGRAIQAQALDAAGGSRTVTITPSAGTISYRARLTVVRGSAGVGGKNKTNLGQTVSVARQGDSSMVFMGVTDWSTGAVGSPVWTPGGSTVASQQGVNATYIFGRWDDSGAAGTANHGISTPSYTTPAVAVLEMLGTAAAPAPSPPPPPPALPPHLLLLLAARNQAQWAGAPVTAAADLDGSAPAAGSAGADMAVDRPLSATAAAAAGAAGSLSVDRPIGAASPVAAGGAASASLARPLAGHADTAADTAAGLARAAGLTGSAPASAGAAGTQDVTRPLAAVGPAAADLDGSLSADRPLAAAASAAAGATADLSIQGQVQLAGVAAASAAATGALVESVALVTVIPAAASAGGGLSTVRPVAGNSVAAAWSTAGLDGGRALVAVGAAAASAEGSLMVSVAPLTVTGARLDVAGWPYPNLAGRAGAEQMAASSGPAASLSGAAAASQLAVSPSPAGTLEVDGS